MKEGALEQSLFETIKSYGGKDLIKEAAEFSLDSVLDDGLLKNIPIVGVVTKLYSVAIGIQGYVFAKKLRKFIAQLSNVSHDERSNFIKQLEMDSKIREKTVDALLIYLDRIDDLEKAPLLANAFIGLVRNDYDFDTFRRLAFALDRCIISDLGYLEDLSGPQQLNEYIGDILVSAGLATMHTITPIREYSDKSSYIISYLGELFLRVVVMGLQREE